MEMPKPSAEHARLHALAGEWEGDETLFPSPWQPDERPAFGRFSARMGVDGMFLISDYEERQHGEVNFRGHGVYGYDPARGHFTMYWFDSMGGSPSQVPGQWLEDTLRFESARDHHRSRYEYQVHGPDSFTFRIRMGGQDGDTWSTLMEGTYRRIG